MVTGQLQRYQDQVSAGKLSQSEAQSQAAQWIKGLRYGDNEYFWINDHQGKIIMHPIKPELQRTFDQANDVAQSFAQGEFGHRMDTHIPGDIGRLAKGINQSSSQAEDAVGSLSNTIKALKLAKANDSHKVDPSNSKGQWQNAMQQSVDVLQTMTTLQSLFSQISRVMHALAQGDFKQKITADVSDQYLELKQVINATIATLENTVTQVVKASEALANHLDHVAAKLEALTNQFKLKDCGNNTMRLPRR